jgi:hypothetical protein
MVRGERIVNMLSHLLFLILDFGETVADREGLLNFV